MKSQDRVYRMVFEELEGKRPLVCRDTFLSQSQAPPRISETAKMCSTLGILLLRSSQTLVCRFASCAAC